MKTCNYYLDACKTKLGLNSDYQLGKHFGWSTGKVSNYRKNRSSFDVHTCIEVAKTLEIDPEIVLAAANYERSNDAPERAIWERIYDKLTGFSDLGKAAGIGLLIGSALLGSPSETHAQSQPENRANLYYVK